MIANIIDYIFRIYYNTICTIQGVISQKVSCPSILISQNLQKTLIPIFSFFRGNHNKMVKTRRQKIEEEEENKIYETIGELAVDIDELRNEVLNLLKKVNETNKLIEGKLEKLEKRVQLLKEDKEKEERDNKVSQSVKSAPVSYAAAVVNDDKKNDEKKKQVFDVEDFKRRQQNCVSVVPVQYLPDDITSALLVFKNLRKIEKQSAQLLRKVFNAAKMKDLVLATSWVGKRACEIFYKKSDHAVIVAAMEKMNIDMKSFIDDKGYSFVYDAGMDNSRNIERIQAAFNRISFLLSVIDNESLKNFIMNKYVLPEGKDKCEEKSNEFKMKRKEFLSKKDKGSKGEMKVERT